MLEVGCRFVQISSHQVDFTDVHGCFRLTRLKAQIFSYFQCPVTIFQRMVGILFHEVNFTDPVHCKSLDAFFSKFSWNCCTFRFVGKCLIVIGEIKICLTNSIKNFQQSRMIVNLLRNWFALNKVLYGFFILRSGVVGKPDTVVRIRLSRKVIVLLRHHKWFFGVLQLLIVVSQKVKNNTEVVQHVGLILKRFYLMK